ncbi:hypothetical protein T439DRAFT_323297 [Meredithblackwellia eburnea MCA 4105]
MAAVATRSLRSQTHHQPPSPVTSSSTPSSSRPSSTPAQLQQQQQQQQPTTLAPSVSAAEFSAMFASTAIDTPGFAKEGRPRANSDPISRGGAFPIDASSHLLAHEPNPFDQSFGPSKPNEHQQQAPRRARSNSPVTARILTPGGVNRLPPVSFLDTPGAVSEMHSFWSPAHGSLRTGPLSPALLNAPTHSSSHTAHNGVFDASSLLRTGLTPLGASGAGGPGGVSFPPPSPATAALFAMMTNNTPGTATDMGLAGGGPRPHEGVNEGNQFDASFATHNSGSASQENGSNVSGSGMDRRASLPATSTSEYHGQRSGSLLANQINGQLPRGLAPQIMQNYGATSYATSLPPQTIAAYPYSNPQQQQQQHQPQPVPGQANNTNPLYLLSQAQDLSQNDDAAAAAAALSNLSGPGFGVGGMMHQPQLQHQQHHQHQQVPHHLANHSYIPTTVGGGQLGGSVSQQHAPPHALSHSQGGSPMLGGPGNGNQLHPAPPASSIAQPAVSGKGKRGAPAPPPAPAPASNKRRTAVKVEEDKKNASTPAKKGAAATRGRGKKKQEDDDDDDEDDEEEQTSQPPTTNTKSNQPETEEEKRKNFLERNRQAALKCRQRKKAWLSSLQSKVELLSGDNETLQQTVTNLKDEVASLRAILAAHANCPIAIANTDPAAAAAMAPGTGTRAGGRAAGFANGATRY